MADLMVALSDYTVRSGEDGKDKDLWLWQTDNDLECRKIHYHLHNIRPRIAKLFRHSRQLKRKHTRCLQPNGHEEEEICICSAIRA